MNGDDSFFNLYLYLFYLYYTTRKSMSQLFRQSAGYVSMTGFVLIDFFNIRGCVLEEVNGARVKYLGQFDEQKSKAERI